MIKEINKNETVCIGGKIHNVLFEEASYVADVFNEKGERLKFCFNFGVGLLSVLDYKRNFEKLIIHYEQ